MIYEIIPTNLDSRFNASDADKVAELRYTCTDPLDRDLFEMDPTTGDLKVIGNIDFEDQCDILLAVCASDKVYQTCLYVQVRLFS